MTRSTWLRALALAVLGTHMVGEASAQDAANRPLRIVSPFPTGTGPDMVARLLGEKISKSLGQPVVVDPRPGASGFLAAEVVRKSPPDGNDLLLVDNGHVTINPSLFRKLPYDVDKDFTPVGLVLHTPFFVVVSSASTYKSVADLVAEARAKPQAVSYGSPFIGSPSHLGSALFQSLTGTRMIHVPFKETSQLWTAVGSGEVTWSLGTRASTASMVQAGRLKLLAIASKERESGSPGVPTVSESGGPSGYEVNAWVGLLAPKGTRPDRVLRLNAALRSALEDPEVLERFRGFGFQPAKSTPDEMGERIRTDAPKYAALVKLTGATAD